MTEKIDWLTYSCNSKLTQTDLFLHEDKLKWGDTLFDEQHLEWTLLPGVSSNPNLPISEKLILNFKNRWDWVLLGENIVQQNKHSTKPFLLNVKFLEQVIETIPANAWDYWLFNDLEIFNWNDSLITYLISKGINNSQVFPYSEEFILNHVSDIDFESLSFNNKINWNTNLLNRFKNKLDWDLLSSIEFSWDYKTIMAFKSNWNFGNKSYSTELVFDEEIQKEIDIIILHENTDRAYLNLSANHLILWNMELIKELKEDWDFYSLASNTSFPWTPDIFEMLQGIIDWNLVFELHENKYPYDPIFKHFTSLIKQQTYKNVLSTMFQKYLNKN